MLISAIGLGIEGKKALKSLLEYDFEIYATDLNDKLTPMDFGFTDFNDAKFHGLELDLGSHNFDKINNSDSIILSPSLWDMSFAKDYKNSGKMLSDVFTKHKSIFTIGVTGTNGKTTTVSMIKDILDYAGLNVLVGGNAGGGFNGYTDIILKAEFNKNKSYDIILIEVCDMTLDYCKDTFDFDLIALTNIGNDHMDVHGSIKNYKNSLASFFKGSDVIIPADELTNISPVGDNDTSFDNNTISKFSKSANNMIIADSYDDINLFGKFNYINAGIAKKVAETIDIASYSNINDIDNNHNISNNPNISNNQDIGNNSDIDIDNNTCMGVEVGINFEIISKSLKNFNPVEGRLKVINYKGVDIFIGKTDNSSAISAILNDKYFPIVFIGTPRSGEKCRYDIFETIASGTSSNGSNNSNDNGNDNNNGSIKGNIQSNGNINDNDPINNIDINKDTDTNLTPETIVLFPGLANTVNEAKKHLENLNFKGNIEIANNITEVLDKLNNFLDNNINNIDINNTNNNNSNCKDNDNNFNNTLSIFIGGNGQEKIIEIQNILENYSKNYSNK
ncbi:MAG: Mur ligase family protein [Methanobacteriaceae archaeon]